MLVRHVAVQLDHGGEDDGAVFAWVRKRSWEVAVLHMLPHILFLLARLPTQAAFVDKRRS